MLISLGARKTGEYKIRPNQRDEMQGRTSCSPVSCVRIHPATHYIQLPPYFTGGTEPEIARRFQKKKSHGPFQDLWDF